MGDKSNWLEYWVDPQTWTFRGDFEGMYRDFDDPWECSKSVSELRRDAALLMLFRVRRFARILDIGCGLGAFTERLRCAGAEGCQILGLDISAAAIAKARDRYPRCSFDVADIIRAPLPAAEGGWDLIVVSEILWYVLPDLRAILSRIHASLSRDGILFIQQYFPANQKFGLEFLRSPAELRERYLEPAGFRRLHELLETVDDGSVELISLTRLDSKD